jgi:hypothetical protein
MSYGGLSSLKGYHEVFSFFFFTMCDFLSLFRWGNFFSQLPNNANNKGVWFERTTLRCKKAREVQKVVQNMSSIAYPVGQSPFNVIDKLIAGPFPIPECVQNELEEMVYDKKM